MPVDNYVNFYIPDKTKKLVTVIRVMYSGRDVDKQLDEFTKLGSLSIVGVVSFGDRPIAVSNGILMF